MLFSYSARNPQGLLQSGTVRAASRESALSLLQREGLVVTRLTARDELSFLQRIVQALPFAQVSGRELALFTREFAALVGAKVPILDTLRVLSSEHRPSWFLAALSQIIGDVESGQPLSAALARHPQIFSSFYVAMVRSGELAGNLEETFNYLAEYEEGQWLLRSRVRGALVYPVLVVGLAIVVAIALLVLVIPQLEAIFAEVQVPLPLPTRLLIGVSNLVITAWWLWLFIIAFLGWWFWQYARTAEGKAFRDRMVLRLPIFGALFRQFYLSRLCESLATLIRGGITLPQSLEITGSVVGNIVFTAVLARATADVRAGKTLTETFGQYPAVLPPFVAEMTAVGEKTGQVEATLANAARFYRQEVDRALANLTNLIEPLFIVILGVVVAILLAAILLPLYNLSQVL